MKKILASILMLTLLLGLCACGSKEAAPADTGSAAVEEDEENYATGDASLDDPRNADEIGENELLVVSFGTSFNDSRRLTIGGIEGALETAFPDWSVRRGFTSQIIIDHVKSRDGVEIDNVSAALDRAMANGVKTLVVQPTHLMHGFEYNDLKDELAGYADGFDQIVMGEPLLTSDVDFAAVADIIVNATAEYDDGETAIVFMGHGTEAESNAVYAQMQQVLTDGGHANYFIGTVEAEPSVDDVLALVQAGNYKQARGAPSAHDRCGRPRQQRHGRRRGGLLEEHLRGRGLRGRVRARGTRPAAGDPADLRAARAGRHRLCEVKEAPK